MADTSNSLPPRGYVLPLLTRFARALNTTALEAIGVLDRALEHARQSITDMKPMHLIGSAVGTDLDDLGAFVGVLRLAGEEDTDYRRRIPATVQHGVSASTAPDMAAFLTASFNVPVVVSTIGPAIGMATFLGWSPTLASALSEINRVKVAGVLMHAQASVPSLDSGSTLVGEFNVGEQPVGGNSGLIFLG